MLIKTAAAHVDHNLTDAQLAHVLATFADREGFFIASVELPPELGTVPCGLHGPLMGDEPIPDAEVTLARRGDRTWTSRLVAREPRPTRTVTVIAGPHKGASCVLYTAFGGPLAPQEPGDLKAQKNAVEKQRLGLSSTSDEHARLTTKRDELREKLHASRAFWAQHALSR